MEVPCESSFHTIEMGEKMISENTRGDEMTEMEERKLQNIGVKVKKIAIGIVIGLGVGIFTLIALFFVLIVLFLYGGPTQRVKGADRYEKTIHKYTQEVVEKVHMKFMNGIKLTIIIYKNYLNILII